MQKITDYALLWQEIYQARNTSNKRHEDHWAEQAQAYYDRVELRWQKPDSTRTSILNTVKSLENPTLIDIGCGPGNFSMFIAPHCKQVISIDPSPSMLSIYKQQAKIRNITNTTIIQSTWAEANLQPKSAHITYSAHSIYGDVNIQAFIKKMNHITTHRCFLLLRVPSPNAVMSHAAQLVWGQPFDSPNFQIAYNTLLQMGVFADVTIETPNGWKPVYSESIAEALEKVKTQLNILNQNQHDQALTQLLQAHLSQTQTGEFLWPKWGESALISWNPTE